MKLNKCIHQTRFSWATIDIIFTGNSIHRYIFAKTATCLSSSFLIVFSHHISMEKLEYTNPFFYGVVLKLFLLSIVTTVTHICYNKSYLQREFSTIKKTGRCEGQMNEAWMYWALNLTANLTALLLQASQAFILSMANRLKQSFSTI